MEFRILGPLEVLDDDVQVRIDGPRQRALLVTLLLKANEVVSTDRLIDELWGETLPANAANALQASVSRLRRCLSPAAGNGSRTARIRTRSPGYILEVAPQAVDASRFERLTSQGCEALADQEPAKASALLGQALDLWRGPALADFGYETFAQADIDRLEELRLVAATGRIEADLARGHHTAVISELRALIAGYPLNESLRTQLMVALYRDGRPGEALQVYREGHELLASELGVEPGSELEQTKKAILRNDESLLADSPSTTGGVATSSVPNPLTSFVGRAQEIDEIVRAIEDQRLVTLTGPGGSGKTRLALQMAAQLADTFRDGIWHVDLAEVPSPRYLVHAIASTLHFSITDADLGLLDARSQLLDYLRGRSMLMILDNFEHLMDGTDLVVDILANTPDVRLLVTSRVRLDLRGEWAIGVVGLPWALDGGAGDDPDALRLFLDRARQANPRLEVTEEERTAALQICSLVEGMPLGLELAAAWASVLPCHGIAREVERGLDFLTTTQRDIPDGHRSLRVVFDHSWQLLDADEQDGLGRLAVFRGAFTRGAAQEVAGVSLALLTDLVGKSLVHRGADDRYRVHAVIRRFAMEHLAEDPGEREAVLGRYAHYHVSLLAEHDQDFVSVHAVEAREEMRPGIADLLDAMSFATTQWADDRSIDALRTLLNYYRAQGLHEGIAAFREIVETLERRGVAIDHGGPAARTLVTAITGQAFCESICGVTTTEARLRECLPILRTEPDLRRELGIGLLCLGTDIGFRGVPRQAAGYLGEALEVLREESDDSLIWPCLLWLGWTHLEVGHYGRAVSIFHEAHRIAIRMGDLLGIAYSLSKLGTVADARGSYKQGKRYHMAALEAFTRLGDEAGPAYAISRMSLSAYAMGDFVEAERLGQEGLRLFVAIGHRWGIGTSYCRIGLAQVAREELDAAAKSLRSALEHALQNQLGSVAIYALIGVGGLLARTGQSRSAAQLLPYVLGHPSLSEFYRPFAEKELAAIEETARAGSGPSDDSYALGTPVVDVVAVVLERLAVAEAAR